MNLAFELPCMKKSKDGIVVHHTRGPFNDLWNCYVTFLCRQKRAFSFERLSFVIEIIWQMLNDRIYSIWNYEIEVLKRFRSICAIITDSMGILVWSPFYSFFWKDIRNFNCYVNILIEKISCLDSNFAKILYT